MLCKNRNKMENAKEENFKGKQIPIAKGKKFQIKTPSPFHKGEEEIQLNSKTN
jgi:hypothetical protein